MNDLIRCPICNEILDDSSVEGLCLDCWQNSTFEDPEDMYPDSDDWDR